MPRICVKAPEIVMSGDINISAAMTVVTKAALESVTIGGDCDCGDVPHITDYVILIDGSDSYNTKCKFNNATEEKAVFKYTKQWAGNLISNLAEHEKAANTTVTLIEFSGQKPETSSYKPGSGGHTDNPKSDHYRVHIEPTRLTSGVNADGLRRTIDKIDAIDGNGQMFLCLQDCAMSSFKNKLKAISRKSTRTTVLIVVTDEEWDLNDLRRASEFGGGKATQDSVCAAVHGAFDEVHMVIVRPNMGRDINEARIMKLAKSNGRNRGYYKVYTESFREDMNKAGEDIMANLGYSSKNLTFFD